MRNFDRSMEGPPQPSTIKGTSKKQDKFDVLRTDREVTVQEFVDSLPDLSGEMKPLDNRDGIHGGSVDGTRHDKFIDSNGDVWMQKTYRGDRLHRAVVDELVSDIASELNLSTRMTSKVGRMNGELKVFVKWEETDGSLWDDLHEAYDDPKRFVERLSADQLKQIVQEQVFDWLIANYDPHSGHFLKQPDGSFLCIDKTQAFKYMGDDGEELSANYNPNAHINGSWNKNYFPIYNLVLPEIKKGNAAISIEEAFSAAKEVLDRVEQMDDEKYQRMIQPYAKFRFSTVNSAEDQMRGISEQEFIQLAMERKRNIRAQFEAFYQSL